MEQRFETFTVLINRIGRSIKRLKAGQMAPAGAEGALCVLPVLSLSLRSDDGGGAVRTLR